MPGRLDELSTELTALLEEIREEAARREIRELQAPLDWLDEANAWLSYELARLSGALPPEAVLTCPRSLVHALCESDRV